MLAPDTILQNRYLILGCIGQGGMGSVYMATDQRLKNTVALKETLFDDEKLRRAFEHEAELLANLHHPALPSVSDHFVEGGGQFLVMQFIPGDDLAELQRQKDGPFSIEEVLGWADQLLDALDYLHTQNPPIVHRDIKPQNLKLTARGHIILLDFGLAKGSPLQASRVTAPGSIFGYTPNYAPLEQIHGTGTDNRSDLYSLGATLYSLLTGSAPPDALTRATAMVTEQPDPLLPATEINAFISPAIAAVLTRAMAQNKTQRFATASEMRAAFQTANSLPVTLPIGEARTVIKSANVTVPMAPPGLRPVDPNATAASAPPSTQSPQSVNPVPVFVTAPLPVSMAPLDSQPDSQITHVQAAQSRPSSGFKWWIVAIPCLILVAAATGFGIYKGLTRITSPVANQNSDSSSVANTPDAESSPSPAAASVEPTASVEPPAAAKPAASEAEAKAPKPTPKAAKGSTKEESAAASAAAAEAAAEKQRQDEEAAREADAARRANERDKQTFGKNSNPGNGVGGDDRQNGKGGPWPKTNSQRNPDGSTTVTITRQNGRVVTYTLNPDGSMRGKRRMSPGP